MPVKQLETPEQHPLISCMMATLGRADLISDAINCFYRQTWPNKELLIRAAGKRAFELTESVLKKIGCRHDVVRVVAGPESETLGAARNWLLEAAAGDIVCQWDDDDLNHRCRLERQARLLLESEADASFLTEQLQYFVENQTLHYCDWAQHEREGWYTWIPGTLMMRRGLGVRYPETGLFSRRHEDSQLAKEIASIGSVAALKGAGELSIYRYHGQNVFEAAHHYVIVQRNELDSVQLRRILPRIEPTLHDYTLPRPFRLFAMGHEVAVYQ